MDIWAALMEVLGLLFAALILGGLCERLKQSAILGYLIAGTLLGPNALNLVSNQEAVSTLAELGLALLLFTIGLEFSLSDLRKLGPIALYGGIAQIVLTALLAAGVCQIFGFAVSTSIAIGAIVALSSTACVLRLLANRSEIDSVYGRNALGILLLQDVAIVPLVLLVSVLGKGGSFFQIGLSLLWTLCLVVIMVALFYIALNYIIPLILNAREAAKNRELPILLAVVTCLGTAGIAHKFGISPALGAFIAGMLLSESPFATQIRADVSSLRTLFVTLFFTSIGMLGNPEWAFNHLGLVVMVMGAVVLGKAAIITLISAILRSSPGHAVATGVCLAQIGELSFILAEVARQAEILSVEDFKLLVTVTIGTLFLTPYLIKSAPWLSIKVGTLFSSRHVRAAKGEQTDDEVGEQLKDHLVLIGFGPAGQRVAETLMRHYQSSIVVVDLNRKSADLARTYGFKTIIGDATRPELLEELHIEDCCSVVVTVPDPNAICRIIEQIRTICPKTVIIARSRYHIHRWQMIMAGAHVVIDEEDEVGRRLAVEARRNFRARKTSSEEIGTKILPDQEI